MPKWAKWMLGAFGLLVVISIAASGSNTNTSRSPNTEKLSGRGTAPCGSKATDDCTPHVGSNDSTRVDALIWRLSSVRQTTTIGEQRYGAGARANGVFVVLKLRVHSDKNESATLTDSAIQLETHGNTYDSDNDGTLAAMGAGEQPFFLDTIGPDSDRRGIVVFDVPPSVLSQKVEVRFNELGFGSTHAYITLPSQIPS